MKKILKNKKLCTVLVLFVAIVILAITNHEKTFLGSNQITKNLFWNSEFLVYDAMTMSYQPGYEYEYGLGEMMPYNQSNAIMLTDEERGFYKGYSTTEKVIAVRDGENTRRIYTAGHTMTFLNGDQARIIDSYSSEDGWLFVEYEADEIY